MTAILQEYLSSQGARITSSDRAEVIVYVKVDVFGTIRSRTDFYLYNEESLKAETSMEISAYDTLTGEVVLKPQVVSYEGEYKEHYLFWMGPTKVNMEIRKIDGLLVDFEGLKYYSEDK